MSGDDIFAIIAQEAQYDFSEKIYNKECNLIVKNKKIQKRDFIEIFEPWAKDRLRKPVPIVSQAIHFFLNSKCLSLKFLRWIMKNYPYLFEKFFSNYVDHDAHMIFYGGAISCPVAHYRTNLNYWDRLLLTSARENNWELAQFAIEKGAYFCPNPNKKLEIRKKIIKKVKNKLSQKEQEKKELVMLYFCKDLVNLILEYERKVFCCLSLK